MGKPFKDKLKNVGDFISGTIAEVEKQAKDILKKQVIQLVVHRLIIQIIL